MRSSHENPPTSAVPNSNHHNIIRRMIRNANGFVPGYKHIGPETETILSREFRFYLGTCFPAMDPISIRGLGPVLTSFLFFILISPQKYEYHLTNNF